MSEEKPKSAYVPPYRRKQAVEAAEAAPAEPTPSKFQQFLTNH